MKTRISKVVIAMILLFTFGGYCTASPLQNSNSVQQAYEQLLKIKTFAFGGVGYVGKISDGEKIFRIVLANTNAAKLFSAAFSNGTDEAKLYALCGLRKLNQKSFNTFATTLTKANPTVVTMSGCLAGNEKASAVIKRINDGAYDDFINRPIK